MLSQRTANLVFAAAVVLACAYFAWVAEGFEAAGLLASSGLPSKFFPQLMLAVTAACAAMVGYLYWRRGGAGGDNGEMVFATRGDAARGLLVMAAAVICYLIWRWLGFIPMAVVLGPLSLLAMGVRNPVIYCVVLALAACVYIVFTYALGIQLV